MKYKYILYLYWNVNDLAPLKIIDSYLDRNILFDNSKDALHDGIKHLESEFPETFIKGAFEIRIQPINI